MNIEVSQKISCEKSNELYIFFDRTPNKEEACTKRRNGLYLTFEQNLDLGFDIMSGVVWKLNGICLNKLNEKEQS